MRLLLDTKKWHKISKNSIKRSFFPHRAKKTLTVGRSHPQELEVSPRSELYLLVIIIMGSVILSANIERFRISHIKCRLKEWAEGRGVVPNILELFPSGPI